MKIRIQLFGKAKEITTEGYLHIEVEPEISVFDLKTVLIENYNKGKLTKDQVKTLILDCAFGNQERILSDQEILSTDQELVILPPVCGG